MSDNEEEHYDLDDPMEETGAGDDAGGDAFITTGEEVEGGRAVPRDERITVGSHHLLFVITCFRRHL